MGVRESVQGMYEASGNFNQSKLAEMLEKFKARYEPYDQLLC